ncbi:MAG: hypothetical protein MI794_11840 [Pseudomonadales bacterium]|nr:hypothetical protein [Pseudomonadales bacterium]
MPLISHTLAFIVSTVFMGGCQASSTEKDEAVAPSGFVEEALIDAIEQTPYAAVVRHVLAERQPSRANDRALVFLHHVEVREVFRGPEIDRLTYALFAEPGESDAAPAEWVIITLCQRNGGYEWPGTGAIFPATEELVAVAREASRDVNPEQQVFEQCEW